MARLILVTLFLSASISMFAQKNEKDIFEVQEFTFYGYDFSEFKLAEEKRTNEDIRLHMNGWINLMKEKMQEEKLKNWFRKQKVKINFAPTDEVAKRVNPETLVTLRKHYIKTDSLQPFIDRYSLSEKDGIGLVMIVECFHKSTKRTSGYFVWFEIANKQIIKADYVDQKEADGYGMVNYWATSLNGVSSNYAADYRRQLKAALEKQ